MDDRPCAGLAQAQASGLAAEEKLVADFTDPLTTLPPREPNLNYVSSVSISSPATDIISSVASSAGSLCRLKKE
jgi:hypothetical protein